MEGFEGPTLPGNTSWYPLPDRHEQWRLSPLETRIQICPRDTTNPMSNLQSKDHQAKEGPHLAPVVRSKTG